MGNVIVAINIVRVFFVTSAACAQSLCLNPKPKDIKIKPLYIVSKILDCKIDFIRYIMPITLNIFELTCSMCLWLCATPYPRK